MNPGTRWGIFNWIVKCSMSENPHLSRPLTCVAWLWKGSLNVGGVLLGTTYRGIPSQHLYLIYCIFNGPGSNWAENYLPKCCISPKAEVIIIKSWCQVEYHHSLNQSFINNCWLPRSWLSPTKMGHLFEFLPNIWFLVYEESNYLPRVQGLFLYDGKERSSVHLFWAKVF